MNDDNNIHKDKVIHHFPGNPGGYQRKIDVMNICFMSMILENKKYTWENSYITFLDNLRMDAFGEGYCTIIDEQNIIANFGNRTHYIKFNEDFTTFSSTRKDDLQSVIGKIILE